ncbi:MAG: protein kinase [Pirellulales bacterium]|nr:protein kinase [Pirellulales bacterium]
MQPSNLPPDGRNFRDGAADAEERLALLVESYDEHLAGESLGEAVATTPPELPPDEVALIERAQRCVAWLERVRRRAQFEVPVSQPELQDAAIDGTEEHSTIGRFELLRELGRGGHGIVYLARDPFLRRSVALKVPRPEGLATLDLRQRFLREGRAAAALAHENVLTVYEAGEIGPICYLAQAFCSGPTLAEWLHDQHGLVAPRIAAELVAGLADGIAHAHAHGVLHRDLKPSNVLLEPARIAGGAPFTPKLTDFGLAKVLEADAHQTVTGIPLGTPAYMPPEQATGNTAAVGPSSDVYGLGAILYELLTGEAPFRGVSPVDTLRKVIHDEPVLPRKLRHDVPPDLEAICQCCLEKEPARRYPSAAELAADIRRYLRGEPTLARPASTMERTIKWARRRPWIAALIVVVCVSLTVLFSTISIYTVKLRGALSASEQSRQTMRLHLYASDLRSAQDAWLTHRLAQCIELLRRQQPGKTDPDLREFAWGYLWKQTHQAAYELRSHPGAVYALQFAPDGRHVWSAGDDGVVRLWDLESQAIVHELRGHTAEVNALALSPDGRWLATCCDKGEVIVWDVDGEPQVDRRWSVSVDELYAVKFSPAGDVLAVAGADGMVRLFALRGDTAAREFAAHAGPVFALAFQSDGRRLFSGGKDGRLLSWNLDDPSAAPQELIADPADAVADLDVSAEDNLLAVARGKLEIYRQGNLKREAGIGNGDEQLSCVRFFGGGHYIAATDRDSSLRIVEWRRGNRGMRAVAGHRGRLYSVSSTPDGQRIATAGEDGAIRIWPTRSVGLDYKITIESEHSGWYRFAVAGDWLLEKRGRAADPLDLRLYRWESAGWNAVDHWTAADHSETVSCDVSANGRWVARSSAHEVLVCDRSSERAWRRFGALNSPVHEVALSVHNDLLLAAGRGELRAWRLSTGEGLWEVQIPAANYCSDLLADDGYAVCVVGYEVDVFEADTGRRLLNYAKPGIDFHSAALVNGQNELLVAASDRAIYRWRLPDGASLPAWAGHDVQVMHLAVHPNRRNVASLDIAGTLKLWDRLTGQVLVTLDARKAASLAFTSDGHSLHLARDQEIGWSQVWTFGAERPAGSHEAP